LGHKGEENRKEVKGTLALNSSREVVVCLREVMSLAGAKGLFVTVFLLCRDLVRLLLCGPQGLKRKPGPGSLEKMSSEVGSVPDWGPFPGSCSPLPNALSHPGL
jgi:hypothetical protein